MHRVAVLALAAATVLAVGEQSLGSSGDKPTLRVLDVEPLTVRGEGFTSRERVRVNLLGKTHLTRRVIANRFGVFNVRFTNMTATRCDLIRVVAIRSGGRRTWVKWLPAPACHTGIGVGEQLRGTASRAA
jgi:hypothetical protein